MTTDPIVTYINERPYSATGALVVTNLTANPGVTIIQHPADVTVTFPDTAVFSVAATGGPDPSPISPEVQAVYDRMAGLSPTEEAAIAEFVDGLVSDGIWASIDEFYCFALNGTDWLTGWVSHTATNVGGDITRTANGAQVNTGGTGVFIDTNVDPSTLSQYALTDVGAGVYLHTAADWGTGNYDWFGIEDSTNPRLRFRHRGSDTNDTRISANSVATKSLIIPIADVQGRLWSVGLTGTTMTTYENGVQFGTTGSGGDGVVPSGTGVAIFGTQDAAAPGVIQQPSRPSIITSFFIGSNIDHAQFYSRLATLQAALGVTGASLPPATLSELTYQWQIFDVTWQNLVEGSPYTGTQTDTLTVSPTDVSMDGDQFRAEVCNWYECVFSNAATLTVLDQETFFIKSEIDDFVVMENGLDNMIREDDDQPATPPLVEAGGPYSGDQGVATQLDGTITPGTDPSPLLLWSIVSGGSGSFSDPNAVDPTFTPDNVTSYTLRLSATPNDGSPIVDTALFTANAVITPPTVDAGGPYAGETTEPIQLNATVNPGSDPAPVLLWTIVSGGTGTFSDNSIEDPTFTPDQEGIYTLRLSADPSDGPPVLDTTTLDSSISYIAPVVSAGGPYSGDEQTPILLSGNVTPGTDPDPTLLWTIQAGGGGTFSDSSIPNPTFTPSGPGDYTLQLSADPIDGSPVTDTASLTSVLVPIAPTVDAGGPYSGDQAAAIQLNGTVTPGTDPAPTLLWTIVSGGTGTFSSASIEDPTFTPDDVGAYVLRLSADPSDGAAVTDTANLTSNIVPVAPSVDAGGPYSGDQGADIQLNATVTPGTDPAPTLLWTIQSGGTGTFSDASLEDPTFTPDDASAYTLTLTVTSNDTAPVADNASLSSSLVPIAPTVDAGGPYSGDVTTAIQLDGTVTPGTDPSPTLLWTIQSGGGGVFSNASLEDPTFTPDTVASYVLQLSADPSDGVPIGDTANLTSNAIITLPTVDAGGPYAGLETTAIQLNSTVTPGSDPSPTLLWTIVSGGTGTFSDDAIEDPTFTPDNDGIYTLQLSADPSDAAPVTDTASLDSEAVVAPTVNAGGPYSGTETTPIQLDGTVTPGTDGSPTLLWTIVSGGTGSFSDNSIEDPTFTPDVDGAYILRLTVSNIYTPDTFDNADLTSTAIIAPTVDAGGPYTGAISTPIQLSGTVTPGTDPTPALLWTIVSGGTGTFNNENAESPTFTPDAAGPYVLQLSADPNDGEPVVDTANLTSEAAVVAPTVDAGGPYSGTQSQPIPLNATVVTGSDPSPAYLWSIDSGGTGTFSNPTLEDPTFTPDGTGAYVLRLSVDPNDGLPVEDTADLTSNAAGGVSPEVQAVFDRMSALSQSEQDAIEAFVDGLVADGIWASLDEFYCFALNGTDYLTGWKAHTATTTGSVIRTANGVEAGDASSHIDTNVDLTTLTQYTLTGGEQGVYAHSNSGWSSNLDYFGATDSANSTSSRHRHTTTQTRLNINAGFDSRNSLTTAAFDHILVSSRATPTNGLTLYDGVQQSAVQNAAPSAIPNGTQWLLRTRNSSTPSRTGVIFTSLYIGGTINTVQFLSRLSTLHTALGVS
jgi:hypothetical protein